MPLYEYECQQCKRRSEVVRKFSDPALTVCDECGGELKKLISSSAIQFKGSGFYINDYARSGASSEGSKGSKGENKSDSTAESKSDSGGEGKGESRSESKSDSSGQSGGDSKAASGSESKSDSKPAASTNTSKDKSSSV